MKRWLYKLTLFLVLGVVINIGIAWAFADLIPRRHWAPNGYGLTVEQGAGWYLRGYEGPGFRWEVGWPFFDVDVFYGERILYQMIEYPGTRLPEVNLDDWSKVFAKQPRVDTLPRLLRIEDSRGWPFYALGRTITMDLTDELERLETELVHQGNRAWPKSEYDLAATRSGRSASKRALKDDAALPLKPLWTGFLLNTLIYAGSVCILYLVCVVFLWFTNSRSLSHRVGVAASIIMFSVLATIANSWACANWGSIGTWSQRSLGEGTEGSGNGPKGIWQVQLNKRFGITRLRSNYFVNPMGSFWHTGIAAESLIPSWAERRIEFEESGHHILLYAAGWPLRALQCRVEFDKVSDGIAIEGRLNQPRAQSEQMPALPYQPIWLGFIGNTVLFIIATTSIFAACCGVTRLRRWRRVRHGGCPLCGYDLQGNLSKGCPECGYGRDKPINATAESIEKASSDPSQTCG